MERRMFQGREHDQTLPSFLRPGSIPPHPLRLRDVTSTGSLSPVGKWEKNKRQKNEQAISQPRAMLRETASSAVF